VAVQGDDTGLQPFWREDLRQALASRVRRPQASPASEAAARRQAARQAARLIEDGQRLVRQSRSAAAMTLFEQAVRLDPGNAEAHYGLGVACLACGSLPQAQASFHQAAQLRPDYTQAHFNIATVFDLQGMAGPAIDSYRAALAHTPNVPEAHEKLAQARDRLAELLLGEGRLAEAAEIYHVVMAAAPNTTRARLSEARLFTIAEDWVAAGAALRRVVAHDPACGPAFEQLGAIAAAEGRFDEARGHFHQAVAVSPQYTLAWLGLVSASTITADDGAMIDRIKALLQDRTLTEPGRVHLHFALGKALEDLAITRRPCVISIWRTASGARACSSTARIWRGTSSG